MKLFKLKILYVMALSLLVFLLLLLSYVGFSTYHSLSSNRQNALTAFHRQAEILTEVLLTSFHILLEEKEGIESAENRESLLPYLIDSLMVSIGTDGLIIHLCLIDENGNVSFHSNPTYEASRETWTPRFKPGEKSVSRYRKLPDGTSVYEVARMISKVHVTSDGRQIQSGLGNSRYLILGLKMAEFEAARKADIHHAVIMMGILIALAGGALFFIYVITMYYRVNYKLTASGEYIELVVSNMANGLLSIDAAGRVISCNKVGGALIGLREEIGFSEIDLSKLIDFKETGIRDTLENGVSIMNREVRLTHENGDVVIMALSVTPLQGKKKNGAVIILQDLREIKRLEEEVRRAEKYTVTGKLAAVVAHEIRNPLSSIRGFAKFLNHVLREDEKSRAYASVIVEEVDRINRVVTELLHFSRPEMVQVQETNLFELTNHVIKLLEGDIHAGSVRVINTIDPKSDTVWIDPDKIKQVLMNLVLNALQVIEDVGTVTISAVVESGSDDLKLIVDDDGPGIHSDELALIFDPFFSKRDQGTGLGLAIVQKIIESHDGKIDAESPLPDKRSGVRFTITLPGAIQKGEVTDEPQSSDCR